MPFPLTLAGRTISTPPQLASFVISDAQAGGGTVVPGQVPSRWVMDLVRAGQLEEPLAVGLAAALLRTEQPGALTEGARLAGQLKHPRLADMLAAAVSSHDVGLLLHPDPVVAGASVEDALLRAWANVADLARPDVRGSMLERLRNAGLTDVEVRVLGAHGTPEEIRRWLPAVFAEGAPRGVGEGLSTALSRGGEVTTAVLRVLLALPAATRHGAAEQLFEWAPALRDLPGLRDRLLG